MNRYARIVLLWLCCATMQAQAQPSDSLAITLAEAENIFLQKNLQLMAQQYQVSASKALEIQAGLYENPTFSTELMVKAQGRPWLDNGRNGQKVFAIDQLILLAGKRNKRVRLAQQDTRLAELQLYELMRTLKYELRQSFYSLAYAQQLIGQLNRQSQRLEAIVNAYEVQTEKRNVSAKDLVRLKTELIQLNSQRNDVVHDAIDAQQVLQLLTDTTAYIKPVLDLEAQPKNIAATGLLEKALAHRSDLQLQEGLLAQANLNVKYQQALATPDLTLGFFYDQNSNYAPNVYSMRAAIDLPFFNRNQGNIKQAKEQVKIAEKGLAFRQGSIQGELAAALSHISQSEKEYQLVQENFDKDYSQMNRGIIENFNKGNISLLEFLDFFESYNSAIQAINQIKKQRILAYEQLEYVVGAPL